MNGLRLFKKTDKNVFEWRVKDFKKYLDVMKELIESTFDCEFEIQKYSYPSRNVDFSYAKKFILKRGDKIIRGYIPYIIKHNVVGFMQNGSLIFPLLQMLDNHYYVLQTKEGVKVNILTNYTESLITLTIKLKDNNLLGIYFNAKRAFPIAFPLLYSYRSITEFLVDMTMNDFDIVVRNKKNYSTYKKYYKYVQPLSQDRLICYNESFDNSNKYEFIVKPFLEELKNRSTLPPLTNFETYVSKLFKVESKYIKNLKAVLTLKDPYTKRSVLDVIKEIVERVMNNDNSLYKSRVSNDLRLKRIRMMEIYLRKLYSLQVSALDTTDVPREVNITNPVNEIFTGPTIQYDNSVNPLAQLSVQTRTTFSGPGGFSNKDAIPLELRNIHESYKGVLDPLDTSSSKSVVNYVVPFIDIDEFNQKTRG